MMQNWRSISSVRYSFNGNSEEGLKKFYLVMVVSLNLALYKTYKGKKYKKFAILFSTLENDKQVFNMYCHEAEFVSNFEQIVDGPKSLKSELLDEMKGEKFTKIIDELPNGKFLGATIIFDEQSRKISLGEDPLQMPVNSSNWLLFFICTMLTSDILFDDKGLMFEYYPLSKLIAYYLDTDKIDFSRIKINPDNFEEWDYYYPEYDREVEESKKRFAKIFEKDIKENEFKNLQINTPKTKSEFIKIIVDIINEFKVMVETEGYKLLFDDGDCPRDESICQTLFIVYLKKYCRFIGIDVTKEPETGRGNIDFRFSKGVNLVAHIEIKKDNNPKLKDSIKKQLKTYMDADQVWIGCLIIFNFGQRDVKEILTNLKKDQQYLVKKENKSIDIIMIDARKKTSASKL